MQKDEADVISAAVAIVFIEEIDDILFQTIYQGTGRYVREFETPPYDKVFCLCNLSNFFSVKKNWDAEYRFYDKLYGTGSSGAKSIMDGNENLHSTIKFARILAETMQYVNKFVKVPLIAAASIAIVLGLRQHEAIACYDEAVYNQTGSPQMAHCV